MVSRIPVGPAQIVPPGRKLPIAYHVLNCLQDSSDRERRSLGVRRMYRVLCPQINESLLTAGSPSHDPALIRHLLDQMGELGFESYCITCWPGVSHDNLDPTYVAKLKEITDYARSKGIIVSGYELMVASRGRGAAQDCVDPATGQPGSPFGQSLCLGTQWADEYFERVWKFIDQTGFGGIARWTAHYHGCPCASTAHLHHRGLADSQWAQWQCQKRMFCRRAAAGHVGRGARLVLFGTASPAPAWASAKPAPTSRASSACSFTANTSTMGPGSNPPTMGGMAIGLIGTYTDDPRARCLNPWIRTGIGMN